MRALIHAFVNGLKLGIDLRFAFEPLRVHLFADPEVSPAEERRRDLVEVGHLMHEVMRRNPPAAA